MPSILARPCKRFKSPAEKKGIVGRKKNFKGKKGGTGKRTAAIVLGALLLFHLIVNLWFLSEDDTPLRDAPSASYLHALRVLKELPRESLLGKAGLLYIRTPDNLGPAYMAPFTLLMAAGVTSADGLAMLNFVFLCILVLALYLLGKELFDDRTALMAAMLITLYPAIYSLSRSLEGRLSLAALVTAALWALVKSERFSSRRYSILFGALLGLAALTKVEFSFFLIIPFLAESVPLVICFARTRESTCRTCLLHLSLALLIAAAVALPWYHAHLGTYLSWHTARMVQMANPDAGLRMLMRPGAALMLARDVLFGLPFYLFLIGMGIFLWKGSRRPFLLGWLLLPYLALFLIDGREGCLTTGDIFAALLPAVALITAKGLFTGLEGLLSPMLKKGHVERAIAAGASLVVLAHLYLLIGVTLSTSGGIPGLRGEQFLNWVRVGCYKSKSMSCSEDNNFCIEIDVLNNKAPSTFGYDFSRLPYLLASGAGEDKDLNMFFLYETVPFSGAVSHLLKEAETRGNGSRFAMTSCRDFIEYSKGVQKSPAQCVDAMSASDVIVLERAASKNLCSLAPHLVRNLEALVPELIAVLEDYDVVYAVRIIPSTDPTRSPVSVTYLQDDTNKGLSWTERGIREPLGELLAIVLLKTASARPSTEAEKNSFREWLIPPCSSAGTVAS